MHCQQPCCQQPLGSGQEEVRAPAARLGAGAHCSICGSSVCVGWLVHHNHSAACCSCLQAHLRGQPPPFSASDITNLMASAAEVSRDLGRAEGDVERYWAAEYMRQQWQRQQQLARRQRLQWQSPEQQQQQQQEPEGLPGMVLGWVRPDNLAAVTLEQLGLENVIKVR